MATCAWVFIASACFKAIAPGESFATLRYALSLVDKHLGTPYFIRVIESPEVWFLRGLIIVEAITGLGLLLSSRRRYLMLASTLAAGFVIFIILLLTADAPVGCGCGFPRVISTSEAGAAELARAILLLALSTSGLLLNLRLTLGAGGQLRAVHISTLAPSDDRTCEFPAP